MHQITLDKHVENTLATADERGVAIVCGWTVLITKDKAIQYVRNLNASANEGFFEQNGKVVLTTVYGAKITMTEAEAQAVITLIREAYKV